LINPDAALPLRTHWRGRELAEPSGSCPRNARPL
jgi:hypothetical protein